MNELQIFNHPDFGQVRTYEENGKVLFCGVDVAFTLGYSKPRNALAQHCKGALKRGIQTNGGMQEMIFIPESDLYRLVFGSKLPTAEKFTDWVTEEVLPSIRQKGAYSLPAMSPAQLLAAQAQLLVDMEQRMNEVQGQTLALEAKVDKAMKALSRPAEDHWRSDMDKAVKELNEAMGWSLPKLRGKLFAELERTVNCDLKARVRRLQERKKRAGMRAKEANELGKLDAIAADKQLRAIFEGIVRSYQAQVVPIGEAAE